MTQEHSEQHESHENRKHRQQSAELPAFQIAPDQVQVFHAI